MPYYNILNKKTNQIRRDVFMTISEMEEYEKKFPNMEVLCGAPMVAYHGVMGLKSLTPDSDFKSRLKQIDKKMPGNHMGKNTKF